MNHHQDNIFFAKDKHMVSTQQTRNLLMQSLMQHQLAWQCLDMQMR